MNRITSKIFILENSIGEKLANGTITKEQVEKARTDMDMDIQEYCMFQELKSLAQIQGILTEEEATSVYYYLGNTVEFFNLQNVAVKTILTKLFSQLLGMRIAEKTACGY